jgi:cellulose synthase/poly-beta-1,6-N-acetylglucosamine synthase-like glycosyltransferase
MSDPKIAILIPAYNEEPLIAGTIKALLSADADRKDIYIVDDRSTDKTAEIARSMGVHVYTVPQNGGKALAQTQALEHFGLLDKYDWIIFLDGDTKVDLYFINAMYTAAVEDPSVALYVGQVKSVKNDHIFSACRAVDYTYGHDVAKQAQSNFNVIFVSPGCCSMYRTDVLMKLYIDHMTLAEDMDLTMQVHRAKGKVKFISHAFVNTQDPSNFKDYHKQILRWYRGFWQVARKHKVFGWAKKQMIDLYMIAIVIDAIIFNRLTWAFGLLATTQVAFGHLIVLDVGVSFFIALWSSYRTKRLDLIWKFPVYYWISYLNFYAFIRSFIEIIVLRKELLAWNKVKRYSFDSHLAT